MTVQARSKRKPYLDEDHPRPRTRKPRSPLGQSEQRIADQPMKNSQQVLATQRDAETEASHMTQVHRNPVRSLPKSTKGDNKQSFCKVPTKNSTLKGCQEGNNRGIPSAQATGFTMNPEATQALAQLLTHALSSLQLAQPRPRTSGN